MRTSTEAFPMDEDMNMPEEEPEVFEESDEEEPEVFEESDDEIPPPPLVRQNAVMGRQGMTLREQEIRFIEEHGLIAFCHGTLVTAILRDAAYLRAQLFFLG